MAKKLKSHTKRRGHKKTPAHAQAATDFRREPQTLQPQNPFRHADDPFAAHHTDDFRVLTESRNSYSGETARARAPLTDRNLQTLLEQNDPGHSRHRNGAVALDMDQYARDQHGYVSGHDPKRERERDFDDVSLYSHDLHKLLLEFGQLNPSLDHLSDLTSLDDVCFPDYYDGLRDAGATDTAAWPDLLILQEFIIEEQDDLKEAMDEVPAGVNFQYPVARKVSAVAASGIDGGLHEFAAASGAFGDDGAVLPTSEETPFLNSVQVDETTLMKLTDLSLRVRPKAIQPWEKSRENVPTILNNKKNVEATYRFTYFREDVSGTIHSPTLSGLVSDSDKPNMTNDQILHKLHALFCPNDSPMLRNGTANSATPALVPELTVSNAESLSAPSIAASGAAPSSHGTHSRNLSQKLESPIPPSISDKHASTSTQENTHVAPFWLDITDPLEEEMKVISKTFGLHPLTTEDIFLGEAREKVELFRQYYFICFTSFDIVYERRKQRAMEHEKKLTKLMEYDQDGHITSQKKNYILQKVKKMFGDDSRSGNSQSKVSVSQSTVSRNNRIRSGELCPLNMYMIIFETGVLTFHFNPTPHPINVRRRARMLKDHLTVSTDWICYALIDDITDSFAPMIDSIEQEVYNIEDEIMKMHSGDHSDNDLDDDDLEPEEELIGRRPATQTKDVFYRRQRSRSVVEAPKILQFLRSRSKRGSGAEYISLGSGRSVRSKSTALSTTKSTLSKIVAWKRKGDMLRRIGECRKRVMSVMRLLGTKADVIRGFSKRFSENETISSPKGPLDPKNNRLALKQEILMYLGDIQDHIVTMVQSLNHYEKLLARSHSNYLAQLNIDMTKVNNDTNDILGKVTILGTIVLPINVVTGLWGMNCIVPGQDHEGLTWFNGILVAISVFSIVSYIYARKVTGL